MKNKKNVLLALIVFPLLLAFFIVRQSIEQRMLSEVYSQRIAWNPKFLESVETRCAASKGLFFISESNIYPIPIKKNWQEIRVGLPLLQENTWMNFLETNSGSSHFPSNLNLGCEYALLNSKDYKFAYSSHCPVYAFSKIGFNENRNQALFFLSQSCGTSIANGLSLLDFVDGHWKVTDTMSIDVQ